ncbi:hypothetical protein [Butyrivibrio sp. INlla21]|uniref:hypothetical protein n=1 Tax=Butyrivibrio sp. INlla21 TaxID=1520811 RepID=UPI0008F140C3|nr:hypothetical protein [Butyrivibrio sp. INlla21]SFU59788.1 hypothetical protein SAMN02910342_01074 [Butyrivibrio sp. INlla21]
MIIMNKLMQEEYLKIKDMDNTFDFIGKLSVINPTIYKIQDGIFIKINDRERVTEEAVDYFDYDELSEYEWSRSEFLIGSYFDGITYEQSLRLAFDLVELWGYKFHALFPNEEFHIIISVSTIDDTEEKTVRIMYYTYRGDDSFHYELDALDDYLDSAIMVNVVEADEEYDDDDEDNDDIEI